MRISIRRKMLSALTVVTSLSVSYLLNYCNTIHLTPPDTYVQYRIYGRFGWILKFFYFKLKALKPFVVKINLIFIRKKKRTLFRCKYRSRVERVIQFVAQFCLPPIYRWLLLSIIHKCCSRFQLKFVLRFTSDTLFIPNGIWMTLFIVSKYITKNTRLINDYFRKRTRRKANDDEQLNFVKNCIPNNQIRIQEILKMEFVLNTTT